MPIINKCRQRFLVETFILFLSIKGRVNFLQLGRYGKYKEQRYRIQFQRDFDFMSFNSELLWQHGSGNYILAMDPSFISKAGKLTPGLGNFWSGQAGKAKRGLEILGIAAIDLDNHTAFHLDAKQTFPETCPGKSLAEIYSECIRNAKVQLQAISRIMVADAWFCKVSFINALLKDGFQLVCRLRDDANLRYLYKGPKTGKKGRPPVYAGKVDHKHIDDAYFDKVTTQDGLVLQTAILNSVTLKRNIRVVRVKVNQKKETYKLYFSTDTSMSPEQILHYYRSRFQIEFIYRDAKQHTALENAQARGAQKLDFHFNMALSAVNIAKAANWLTIPKEERGAFSMADIKTMNHNALILETIFNKFGINPDLPKNQKHVKELILYGTKAA